jgi:hypothetical protein
MAHQNSQRKGQARQEPNSAARTRPRDSEMQLVDDLSLYFRRYARERPESVALLCLGIGFVLGWKLKPW